MAKDITEDIKKLLANNNQGVKLDIACGRSKRDGWVGIDYQDLPGVDIVHNIEVTPWPLPDGSVSMSVASHIMEHLDPHGGDSRLQPLADLLVHRGFLSQEEVEKAMGKPGPVFMRVMDEIWRITKIGGQLAMVMPYAGSPGDFWDPTHINHINETTWTYYDPEDKTNGFSMWQFYQPKPWKIEHCFWHSDGTLEVLLQKRLDVYSVDEKGLLNVTSPDGNTYRYKMNRFMQVEYVNKKKTK